MVPVALVPSTLLLSADVVAEPVAVTVTTAAFEQMKGEYADLMETFFPTTMIATVEEQEEKEQVA